MQSQDLASGLWSFGLRLPGWRRTDVEASVTSGEVLRTWTQRGTIHFVAAEDARWMLDLCGSRLLRHSARRREQLGISEADAEGSVAVLRERLAGRQRLTRADAVAAFAKAGIDATGSRAYHLLWYAAQIGVTCIGPNEGKQQTYVLLAEWAPEQVEYAREEALAELALRYFRSHGPTTYKDFAGWSGLTVRDAKSGIAGAGDRLQVADFEGKEVYLAAGVWESSAELLAGSQAQAVHLLPGFDEYLLGIKDRAVPVPAAFSDRIIPGNNGVFQPTIMMDGRVVGTWKRAEKKTRVDVELMPFESPSAALENGLPAAIERYADYLGLPVQSDWVRP